MLGRVVRRLAKENRLMFARSFAVVLAALLFGGGCAFFKQEREMNTLPAGENPATYQGEHDMDADLCWQEIQSESDSPADAQAAHAACMAKRGWVEQR